MFDIIINLVNFFIYLDLLFTLLYHCFCFAVCYCLLCHDMNVLNDNLTACPFEADQRFTEASFVVCPRALSLISNALLSALLLRSFRFQVLVFTSRYVRTPNDTGTGLYASHRWTSPAMAH
jgi:hypothetical protein